jgi:hypothetical protein
VAYNPFTVPIGATLRAEHLSALIKERVTEGYNVEFKVDLPTSPKIAKGIAALANTLGGWFIVGVKTDGHNVAQEIVGIDTNNHHDPVALVRDAARSRIDPVPVFNVQAIPLETGRIVITVYVPDGQSTPFITSDGRIYRRTHDSSEPVAESNRYAIDQLIERGREVEQAFERWSKDPRSFAKAETHGWVKIYLSPYPLGAVSKPNVINADIIKSLLDKSKAPVKFPLGHEEFGVSGHTPLNNAYTTATAVVLRRVVEDSEAFSSLMVQFDQFGRARIFIPLYFDEPEDVIAGLSNQSVKNIVHRRKEGPAPYLRFFDLASIWLQAAVFVNYYLDWLTPTPQLGGFDYAIEIDNVWRSVGFCDDDKWSEHVETLGLPAQQVDYLRFPSAPGASARHLEPDGLWVDICADIGLMFGLPREQFHKLFARAVFKVAKTRP